ncbi:hypothetical protein Q5P01_006929 [Channa striata]|uniref:B30.2/SPRY domain-containing protein n=1 Tax=Channa striata TaxID=64152 RepID=A0AA88SZ92_CHASR|nr:hypothetical protein Q5P01_006929 [Channa striata]
MSETKQVKRQVSAAEAALSKHLERQSRQKSSLKPERPEPPEPSDVSIRSCRSKSQPAVFSKDQHYDKKRSSVKLEREEPPEPPEPSYVSIRSNMSKKEPIEFSKDQDYDKQRSSVKPERPKPPEPSDVSIRSDRSKNEPIEFNKEQDDDKQRSDQHHQPNLRSVFMRLDTNIVAFIKRELKKFEKVLDSECAEDSERLAEGEDEESVGGEEEKQRTRNRESFLKLTLNFMRSMKEEELADRLHSKTCGTICQPSEEGLLSLLPVVKESKTSLLSGCNLRGRSCEALAKVLTSKNTNLRELDLSNNDLHDLGVKLLSEGLASPHCHLEVLRLSGCRVTEEGCASLVSALKSNPSHLRELDLSFNHPGDSGIKQLTAILEAPASKLETLKVDNCDKCRLEPSPIRFFCNLSLDTNTANRNLSLSDYNRGVVVALSEEQTYADHSDRFDIWKQLLCSDGLTGRCYWEVQWKGKVDIGVTYRGIRRSGDGDDCCIGWNDQSWSLSCTNHSFTAWHNNTPRDIDTPKPSHPYRVAVYLDWPAGTLSFYSLHFSVSPIRRTHIHTFQSTFTEPLYPAFGFGRMLEYGTDSTMSQFSFYLPQVEE